MKNLKIVQTIAYFLSFIALGLAMTSLGPTLPGLAKQTGVDLGQIGYLLSVRSFGFLLGSLFGGRFYDRMRGNAVMAAMLFAISATLAVMPMIAMFPVLLSLMLLLGIAEGAVGVGGNALLVWVHQSRVAPFMNALHFFFGVGGMLAPLLVARTLSSDNTTALSYFVLAALVLPAAALLMFVPTPKNQLLVEATAKAEPIKYRLVGLIALLLCLDIGTEIGFGNLIFGYVLEMELGDKDQAAYVTSLFWGLLTAGRLLGIPLAALFRPRTILLADLIGCLLSIGLAISYATSFAAIAIASACLGLSLASVYPMALAFAGRRMEITGQVTGFLLVGGSVGGMIIPFLFGWMFQSFGPRVMLFIVLFDLLLALMVYLALVFDSSSKHRTEQEQQQAV